MVRLLPVLVAAACVAGCSAKHPSRAQTRPIDDGVHYAPTGFVGCGDSGTVVHGVSLCETSWACVNGGRIKCIALDGGLVDVPSIPLVKPKPATAITSGSVPQAAAR